jgi:hypothetical protein
LNSTHPINAEGPVRDRSASAITIRAQIKL